MPEVLLASLVVVSSAFIHQAALSPQWSWESQMLLVFVALESNLELARRNDISQVHGVTVQGTGVKGIDRQLRSHAKPCGIVP